jgi:hypothetical protein
VEGKMGVGERKEEKSDVPIITIHYKYNSLGIKRFKEHGGLKFIPTTEVICGLLH